MPKNPICAASKTVQIVSFSLCSRLFYIRSMYLFSFYASSWQPPLSYSVVRLNHWVKYNVGYQNNKKYARLGYEIMGWLCGFKPVDIPWFNGVRMFYIRKLNKSSHHLSFLLLHGYYSTVSMSVIIHAFCHSIVLFSCLVLSLCSLTLFLSLLKIKIVIINIKHFYL